MLQFKLAGGFHKDFILIAVCLIVSQKFSRVHNNPQCGFVVRHTQYFCFEIIEGHVH